MQIYYLYKSVNTVNINPIINNYVQKSGISSIRDKIFYDYLINKENKGKL